MHSLHVFCKLPWRVKGMLLEALWASARYRWLILHKPFASLSARLGLPGRETPLAPQPQARIIGEISHAVTAVCRRTPWESKCLVQAFVAKQMLRRRGLPSTAYLGVTRGPSGALMAHAWLRCGNAFVTGGDGSARYTVTGFFS